MAFDEYLGERITGLLNRKKVDFYSKKMMGGLIFMVNDKMCCGIHLDKKSGFDLLMAKIGVEVYKTEIEKEVCLPMDFTGRAMKGFIFILPEGYDLDRDLDYWVTKAVSFNSESIKK